MKFHAVHYSKDCVSLCSAEVHYSSKQAVEAVVKQYNGVPLDGWPLCLASINQAGGKIIACLLLSSFALKLALALFA